MDAQSLQVQALITFITPFLLQLAKRSQSRALAWIDQSKPKICVLASAAAALMTSMEIEVIHAPHRLTITWADGPTLVRGLLTFLVAAAVQFGGQHIFYDSFWRHVVPAASNQSPVVSHQSLTTEN
jgi:hypothetical protein